MPLDLGTSENTILPSHDVHGVKAIRFLVHHIDGIDPRDLQSLGIHPQPEGYFYITCPPTASEPWAPLPTILTTLVASLNRNQRLDLLQSSKVYCRHQTLFEHILGLRDTQSPNPEDLIHEEIPFEQQCLRETLGHMVRTLLEIHQRGIILTQAQRMSHEALGLFQEALSGLGPSTPILVVFKYGPTYLQPFNDLDSLGNITWWSKEVQGSPLEFQTPSEKELQTLVDWLCYQTIISILAKKSLDGESLSLPIRIGLLQAYLGVEDLQNGILLGADLLRDREEHKTTDQARTIYLCLISLYRLSNDPESVRRILWLQRNLTKDEFIPGQTPSIDQLRQGFARLENYYQTLDDIPGSPRLEPYLISGFNAIGWFNHGAFASTRSLWLRHLGSLEGWESALKLCQEGFKVALEQGNLRRMAGAYQSFGILYSVLQRPQEAIIHAHKAVVLARKVATPLQMVKAINSLGYLFFAHGEYKKAFYWTNEAFKALAKTQDHHEYLGTLTNLGRLYLHNGQYKLAEEVLTAVLQKLGHIANLDLPFHPKASTNALLGLACALSGQHNRATEFLVKAKNHTPGTYQAQEYCACLELLLESQGTKVDHRQVYQSTVAQLSKDLGNTRHILVWISIHYAWLLPNQDRVPIVHDIEEHLVTEGLHGTEKAMVQALVMDMPSKNPRPLPVVTWNMGLLERLSEQEITLRTMRQRVFEYDFLYFWQKSLLPGLGSDRLMHLATELLVQNFPLNQASIVAREYTKSGREEWGVLATYSLDSTGTTPTGPGDLPHGAMYSQAIMGQNIMDIREFGHAGYALIFPLSTMADQGPLMLVCTSAVLNNQLGQGQVRVIGIAANHLSLLLLAEIKAKSLVTSEKLASLGALVATVSHELNTPLGTALTCVTHLQKSLHEVLDREHQNTLSKKLFHQILEDAGDSSRLLEQNIQRIITLVGRFKASIIDPKNLKLERFLVSELCRELEISLGPSCQAQGVSLICGGPSGIVAWGYTELVIRLVVILVQNALIHGFSSQATNNLQREIHLEWSETSDLFILEVRDNGIGMVQDQIKRLFEPLPGPLGSSKPTGLGLHTAYTIATKHLGGSIQCMAKPMGGARFVCTLPKTINPD